MSGRPTEEQVRVRYRDSEGGRMNRWFAILTKEFIWNRLHCNSNTSKMKPIVTGFASNPVLLSVCELYVLIMAHTTVVNIMSGLFGHLPTSFSRFSTPRFLFSLTVWRWLNHHDFFRREEDCFCCLLHLLLRWRALYFLKCFFNHSWWWLFHFR